MSIKILTPIQAHREHCKQCTQNQLKEIRLCTVKECASYPYRMGKRPKKMTLESNDKFNENNRELS